MTSVANETQVNFNPSWMQSVAKSDRAARMDRTNRVSVSTDEELMPPVFAKNRYGREDILALIGKGTNAPEGLDKCTFFVEAPQAPIILQPLSDIEERLQQNINSSKALSSLPKSRQQLINGGSSPDIHPNTGWTTISGNRGGPRPANRWSGLGSSSGNGPGDNAGYRPGRGNLMRINSGGHNSNDPGAGNRWSGLSSTGTAIHDHTSGYRPARGGLTNIGGRGGGSASLRQISAPQTRDPEKTEDNYPHLSSHSPEPEKSPPPLPKQNERENGQNSATASDVTLPSNHYGVPLKESEKIISTTSSPNILVRTTHSTSPLKEELNKPERVESETKWLYLDPTDTQQGPFETKQMMLWYNNGFFKPDLRLRSTYSTTFTTLGDLIRINGTETPFVQRAFTQQNLSNPPTVSSVFSNSSNIWGPPTSPAVNQPLPVTDPEADKIWASKQRQLAEETRKLKEKEEALKREEQGRAEKERLMLEKELELTRKQEEINRIVLEREAKLRREQEELINRERQLAEFERQKMEEFERETQRLQLEMQRQRQAKEEEERQKQREIEKMIEREKEKQRLEFEAKLKREQQEKEESLRRAYEEMQESNRKKVEEERLRRIREEEERKIKAHLEENARREQFEKERLRQIADERQQGKMREILQPITQTPEADFDHLKSAPWVQISTKLDKSKEKQAKQENRTFAEIQEEEYRQMKIQQQQQKELFEQQRKQMEPISGAWGKSIAKTSWNPSQPSSGNQFGGFAAKKSPPVGSSNAPVWNVQPPVTPAPIPPAPNNKNPTVKQAKKNEPTKTINIGKPNNEFTNWIIRRVKELNSSIDAEVFATFIESVDNPDDAEDYIVGYLGDGKEVKAFHRELINKRIEMRTRAHATPKDDLSKAAAATTTASSAKVTSGATNSAGNSNNGGNKKKKKGKGNEKVITGFTGFKTTGDPNRLNVGEIDNTPPVKTKR